MQLRQFQARNLLGIWDVKDCPQMSSLEKGAQKLSEGKENSGFSPRADQLRNAIAIALEWSELSPSPSLETPEMKIML